MYSSSSTRNITKSYISSSSVCIYRIYTYSSYVKSVEIDINDLSSAEITIFTGSSSTNSYDYKGTMKEDDKKSFTLDYNTDTYIVVEPSSYYNKIDIDLEASSSSPSSSSNAGAIVGAVLGALFGVGILICIIV